MVNQVKKIVIFTPTMTRRGAAAKLTEMRTTAPAARMRRRFYGRFLKGQAPSVNDPPPLAHAR